MSEWKEYGLNEIASFSQGKQIPVGDQFENNMAELERFIRIVDFTSDWTQSPRYVKKDDKYRVCKNDIVMLRYGTPGKVFRGHEGIIANNMFKISPDESIVTKEYLYWFLYQDSVYKILMANQSSSTMPAISFKMLSCVNVKVPSFETQQHISSFFDSLDDKIAVNRRICENLEAQAQALFKHWFIDYAPFKNGKFVESELGMIPEGWRVGTLGDYCKVKSGFAFKSSMWTEKGCPVIKIKNITNSGRIDMTDCSYISKQNVAKAKAFKANRGDLVIAMTGATIGKFSILPQFDDETYINQRVGKFFLGNNPLEKLPYVFCLLSDNRNRKQLTTMGQGSAQPNISGSDIESIIAVYSNNVIESFNEICYPMFDMILTKQEENLRLSTLRDTLLPKLMSGQIKV